jgi:hypothetical protein
MSHCTTIDVKMKDITVLKNACKELGIDCVENTNVDFFDGKREHGTKIKLPNWRYPVCVKSNGEIIFDNYEGNWGDIKELNTLKQRYAVEKTKLVAKKNGYTFTEKKVGNDIKLFVNV